ncbi:MAG: hypothetical protein U1E66_04635 [Rhodospirillales bacterium]
MTKKDAFEMGFRHVADLATMSRIADLLQADACDPDVLALMEAWREGALAARELLAGTRSILH